MIGYGSCHLPFPDVGHAILNSGSLWLSICGLSMAVTITYNYLPVTSYINEDSSITMYLTLYKIRRK